jgi:hypothetical protein
MPSYKGSTGVYEDEMLVVDLPFMERVREKVTTICGRPDVIDRAADEPDHDLKLTRFHLPHLAETSQVLRRGVEETSGPARLFERIRPPSDGASDLDRLLFLLRLDFAKRNGGWVPEMGKDRKVGTVTGLPHLSGGLGPTALSYPKPVPAGTYVQAADRELGNGVRVGMIDTKLFRNPADPRLPLPASQVEIDAADLATLVAPTPHWLGHGVFGLGLIAAQAPAITIVYRGVLDDEHARATSWDVARAIVAMRDKGIQILNLSLGVVTEDGQEPLVLARAIQQFGRSAIIVAAAGNHGDPAEIPLPQDERWPKITPSSAAYPGADRAVVAVGALDGIKVASFSPKVSWVQFFAEGGRQVSTYLTGSVAIRRSPADDPLVYDAVDPGDEAVEFNGFAEWAGTSMSSAVISGRLAALTATTPGRDPFAALERLAEEAQTGSPSITAPTGGSTTIRLAQDSEAAEEKWRRLEE